jgi:hypothetical protein
MNAPLDLQPLEPGARILRCLDHRTPCQARRPTYALFHQNVVGEVAQVEAVRDRVNVPFWVVQIHAAMGE